MSDIFDTKLGPFSILQLIGLLGAIIGIASLALNWISVDGGFSSYTLNAFDVMDEFEETYKFFPSLSGVFAILALILILLDVFVPGKATINAIFTLVFGLLSVVFAVLFYTAGDMTNLRDILGDSISFTAVWVALVGGVLVLIPGIIGLAKSLK